jgi:hypothetical protein
MERDDLVKEASRELKAALKVRRERDIRKKVERATTPEIKRGRRKREMEAIAREVSAKDKGSRNAMEGWLKLREENFEKWGKTPPPSRKAERIKNALAKNRIRPSA